MAATIASLIVKIGAQDQQISDALTKLVGDAKKADTELNKLGDSPLGQQAVKSIEALSASIKQVTDNQQRIADRSVQAAQGLDLIGGASRLTKRELDQVNTTIQNGLDAFRALGQEAPRDLQRMADAVTKQREALQAASKDTGIFQKASSLLSSTLGIGFGTAGVAGAIGFAAKQALDYADSLTKLSDRTGIGVTALQRLGSIASASGNSLEDIAGAVNQFQKRIAGGDQSAVDAINRLGVSFSALKSQSPDQQFITLAKAIQQIKDPAEQARAAFQLFGKAGAELLPTLKGDIDTLADATVRMSEESVKALDEFGDALGHLKTSAVNVIGDLAGSVLVLLKNLKDLPSAIREARDAAKSGAPVSGGAVDVFGGITAALLGSPLAPFLGTASGGRTPSPSTAQAPLQAFPFNGPGGVGFSDVGSLAPGLTGTGAVAARKALQDLAAFQEQVAKSQKELFSRDTIERAKLYTAALGDLSNLARLTASEHDKLSSTLRQAVDDFRTLGLKVPDNIARIVDALDAEDVANRVLAQSSHQVGQALIGMNFSLDQLANLAKGFKSDGTLINLADQLTVFARQAQLATEAERALEAQNKRTAAALTTQLAGTIGLPNVGPQNAGLISDATAKTGGGIGSLITSSLAKVKELLNPSKILNTAIGTGIGGLISGGIGAAISGIGSLFGKLFNNPEKQINPIREAFVQAAGGLAELNKKAFEATGSLALVQNLLAAKNAEQYTAAINALNNAFDFQGGALQTLTDTAAKYGFTLAELPEKFRQGKLDEQFLELFKDQEILKAGGFEFDAILKKQAQSFVELIKTARDTGSSIPAQLKPSIEKLDEMGLLVDENGDKLTGLSELTWAETLDQKFSTLIDTIKELANTIANSLGTAIGNLPTEKTIHIGFNVDPVPDLGNRDLQLASSGGRVTPFGIQHFGGGGVVLPFIPRGTDTIPAMLTPGEVVLNDSQQRAIARALQANGAGGLNTQGIENRLETLNRQMQARDRSLPQLIALQVASALAKAG